MPRAEGNADAGAGCGYRAVGNRRQSCRFAAYQLIGGPCRESIPFMATEMLRRESADANGGAFCRLLPEAAALKAKGFAAVKMKIGIGARDDIKLAAAAAVRFAMNGWMLLLPAAALHLDTADRRRSRLCRIGYRAQWISARPARRKLV